MTWGHWDLAEFDKGIAFRFNAITGKYQNVKIGLRAAGMIDHLDIRSTIVHRDSKEVSVHKSSYNP